MEPHLLMDFPGGSAGKEPTCQCRRHKRRRFDPRVWKIPLEKGMATHSCILAWKIPWTESSLAGYSPWDHRESDTTECTHIHIHVSIDTFLKGSFYIKCFYKLSYSIIPHFTVYFCSCLPSRIVRVWRAGIILFIPTFFYDLASNKCSVNEC